MEGENHFGGRIVFTPEGHLLLTMGERFKFDPAQNLSNHLDTIVRLNTDGSVPQAGRNYGWPVVSWGENYDGTDIPDPPTQPRFANAVIHWIPVISPSGMIFYTGSQFPQWQGSALIGGQTSKGIVRVKINGEQAEEVERISLNVRTRDVEQAPDGSVYVLTDQDNGEILGCGLNKDRTGRSTFPY